MCWFFSPLYFKQVELKIEVLVKTPLTFSPQTDLLVRGSDVALVYAIAAKSALSLTRCGPMPVKRELLRLRESDRIPLVSRLYW